MCAGQNRRKGNAIELIVWTLAGLALGYLVLGGFVRGPGDPDGIIVGPVFGGLLGLAFAILRNVALP
jgi:hypothetical protein